MWGWQDSAACRGLAVVLFFGPDREPPALKAVREEVAREVCGGCPVRAQCLEFAVSRPEKSGMWGGRNEEERRAAHRNGLRAQRRRATVQEVA